MFNIGGGEVLVIALIALIVLGPERLPGAARQAGKVMSDLRRMSAGFQSELKGAFDDAEDTSLRSERRNVLGTSPREEASPEVGAAVASVSDQAPAKRAPAKRTATKKAPAKKAPAKKAAAKKTGAKKVPAKAVTKRAAPAKRTTKATQAVPTTTRRRTSSR